MRLLGGFSEIEMTNNLDLQNAIETLWRQNGKMRRDEASIKRCKRQSLNENNTNSSCILNRHIFIETV